MGVGAGDEVNVVGLAVVKAEVLDDFAPPPLPPLSDLEDPFSTDFAPPPLPPLSDLVDSFFTDLAPPPLIPPLSDLVDPLIVGPAVPDLLVGLAVVGLGVVGHIVGGSVGSWGQSSGFSPKKANEIHKSSMICSGS